LVLFGRVPCVSGQAGNGLLEVLCCFALLDDLVQTVRDRSEDFLADDDYLLGCAFPVGGAGLLRVGVGELSLPWGVWLFWLWLWLRAGLGRGPSTSSSVVCFCCPRGAGAVSRRVGRDWHISACADFI
jgi:hypothetical protein